LNFKKKPGGPKIITTIFLTAISARAENNEDVIFNSWCLASDKK
jgi:hypothetical protein